MIRVSLASTDDVAGIVALVEQYWRFEQLAGFDAERVTGQLARLLAAPGLGHGWVARSDDCVVGYLLLVFVFSLENLGVTAEIDEFFVQPAHRGRGLGAQLLAAAEAACARAGCTNISLQLERGNHAARRFYSRHGYTGRERFELLEKDLPGV